MAFAPEDVDFLLQHRAEIADIAASGRLTLTKKSQVDDAALLHREFGEYGRAVRELLGARATGKIPHWWLADGDAAQQATPAAVAAFRARELAAAGVCRVADVTCSIGTEGSAMTEAGLEYFGFDLDASRVRMAAHNVPGGHFARADAVRPAIRSTSGGREQGDRGQRNRAGADAVIADPARRAGGRRLHSPEALQPPLPDLLAAYPGAEMAIKCAPGLDYSFWDGGVTVTSVRRGGAATRSGVKEVCLYTPGLSTQRRAVILDPETGQADIVTRSTHADGDAETIEPNVGEPGRYIIDPDGAIVRAGLVRDYAAREGLWQLDERIAYLTGDRIPAGTSAFPFIEQVPVKKVKQALIAADAGSVEILVRGLDIDPDAFRKKLKLKGSQPRAVVLTRIGKAGVGLICGARMCDYDEPEVCLTNTKHEQL